MFTEVARLVPSGMWPPDEFHEPGFWHSSAQDCGTLLRSLGADSFSPQTSAILVGHVTGENDSLRKSPQNFNQK